MLFAKEETGMKSCIGVVLAIVIAVEILLMVRIAHLTSLLDPYGSGNMDEDSLVKFHWAMIAIALQIIMLWWQFVRKWKKD